MGFSNARLTPFPVSWFISRNLGTTQLTADKTELVFRAPFACQVIDPGFVTTNTAVAKSATNHFVTYLLNAGAAGTGTSSIASATVGKTANVAANIPTALTLSGTVAWHKLDAGDYLAVKHDEVGALTLFSVRGSFGIMYGHSA